MQPKAWIAALGLAVALSRAGAAPVGAVRTGVAPSGVGAAATSADLVIDGNVLHYYEKDLRFQDRAETWLSALGKPSASRENGASRVYTWDSLGLELYATHTPDKRAYASRITIKLGRFPVSLFGLPLVPPVHYREIQQALAPKAAFIDHPGRDLVSGGMILRNPDGFPVSLSAELHCDPNGQAPEPTRYNGHIPIPRKTKGDACTYVFDTIELSASGYLGWN